MTAKRRPYLGLAEQGPHDIASQAKFVVLAHPELAVPVLAVVRIGDGATEMTGLVGRLPAQDAQSALRHAVDIHWHLPFGIKNLGLAYDAPA